MAFKTLLVLISITFKAQAFWWQPTTTETPAISVKHIPLTYFRTYTYQPLTGGPFTFPFSFGAGAPQTPLLNGGRYEHFSYPASQQFHGGAFGPQSQTSTKAPTTPTTTTTTTTTTTPPPPTTTTTTSTTTTSTTTPAPQRIEPIINSGGGTFGPAPSYPSSMMYPNYNRRMYMSNLNAGNYYRPHYPYPDYASIPKPASMLSQQRPSHVQFVPCMCPVSVGVPSGLPIVGGGSGNMNLVDPSNNLYMPQARSSNGAGDDDADMELPLDDANNNDDEDILKAKSSSFSEIVSRQSTNDEAFLSDDDVQSLETNNIDNNFRQSRELTDASMDAGV